MVWKCFPLNLHNWSNSWKWKEDMVNSPCTGKCELDFFDICRKCQRTKDEISRWYVMTDEEKTAVLERLLNDTP